MTMARVGRSAALPSMTKESDPPMNIPMSSPDLTQAEIDAVTEVLQTPTLSLGPRLQAFEEAFARYTHARHATGVNAGTSGLHLAIIAAGIQTGDEVITPSFSFIASANCALYEGARPVFVDIDPLTANIDPAQIEDAITGRTRAILPVHAFGQPADMDPILDIARRHSLVVIEDACEALGAEYKGRPVGTMGHAATFAFYPNKQMTTGEGGMLITNDDQWADLFHSLRNQGRDASDTWLNHTRLGYNYRMDEMSAALGLVQLSRIEELLARRAQVADWYIERIAEIPGLQVPYIAPTTTRMSWFVFVIRCDDSVNRNALMDFLARQKIPSRPYFTPIHLQPFYRERFGWKRGDLPHTENAGDTFLALPFSSVMTEEQVDVVCSQLRAGVAQLR